jgi:hypothetical protein
VINVDMVGGVGGENKSRGGAEADDSIAIGSHLLSRVLSESLRVLKFSGYEARRWVREETA